jgi:hypothetical protein
VVDAELVQPPLPLLQVGPVRAAEGDVIKAAPVWVERTVAGALREDV